MILIFSISKDPPTNNVVAWLKYAGANVFRFNFDETPDAELKINYTKNNVFFETSDRKFSLDDVTAVWYRKGSYYPKMFPSSPSFEGQEELNTLIEDRLILEEKRAGEYLQFLIKKRNIRILGNATLGDPNKFILMWEAVRIGLEVPAFNISNSLLEVHKKNPEKFITKAISDCIYLWDLEDAKRAYFSYTEDLQDILKISDVENVIPLSVIQSKIKKDFELRVFYLDGVFIAGAILSQNDPQTATDHRKYNIDYPNRVMPFVLPQEIREKLQKLFDNLELNTGSVDIIVGLDGKFYFLEVNPVGMYAPLSNTCNYRIDEAISAWLQGQDHNEYIKTISDDTRSN
ncbi:grasp-with-spasm system ATP-grasp peptide maturase [Hellea sp.]|nr:grasp-with-spasm system ATP-grasp peptide maturase [Hellea sp.]